MSLSPVYIDAGTRYSWPIMPVLLQRIREFSATHANTPDDNLANVVAAAFGAQAPEVLVIAIMDDSKENIDEALVGHVVGGVEQLLGRAVCMIYQFEKKDTDADWREVNKAIQGMVDMWVRKLGLDEVMAMAESDSRAKLFSYFGYVRGPVLLRRKFDG